MKFLLTLLALLTGLAGADRAVAAPVAPVALGSVMVMAEAAAQAGDADKARRPSNEVPTRRSSTQCRKPPRAATPLLPGLLTPNERALE